MLQVTVVLYYHQKCLLDKGEFNNGVHTICNSKVVFAEKVGIKNE